MNHSNPRILMINDHIHFGGGGDAVFRLERMCYEDAGFEVFTFSQADEKPRWASDRDFVAIESKSRVIQRAGKFLASPSVSRSLHDTLQTVRPHLISVHLVSKYPLSVYPQLNAYPVVNTLHGSSLFCATAWGCLKDGRPCELGIGMKCFTRGCQSLPATLLYCLLNERLQSSVKRNVDLFVCPSRHIQKSAESFDFAPTEFIPLGIDDGFAEQKPSTHDGPPIVLSVGTLAESKGVHILLEAFPLILKRVPKAQLLIAGRGPKEGELRELATDLGLHDSVQFLGFVEHTKMVGLYQRASVLAMPSIWSEQFGLIGPEALACGIPCVGSNSGGIPEWLHDGEWGFTVPSCDPVMLSDKIVTLLEDHDLRREYGAKGREWALKQYAPRKYRENRLRLAMKYIQAG